MAINGILATNAWFTALHCRRRRGYWDHGSRIWASILNSLSRLWSHCRLQGSRPIVLGGRRIHGYCIVT